MSSAAVQRQEAVVVVGAGIVGLATGQALAALGHQLSYVDVDEARRSELRGMGLGCSAEVVLPSQSSIVLLSPPTPVHQGRYELGALEAAACAVADAIVRSGGEHLVVIRSTVPPGTAAQRLAPLVEGRMGVREDARAILGAAPEFLRERCAAEDARAPRMVVTGSADPAARTRLAQLFAPLGGEQRSFADTTTPEMIKVVHNALNATKISFFNELARLSSSVGVDPEAVAEVVVRSAEASWNPDYGTRSGAPFGGSCLPKDLEGLLGFAEELGLPSPLLAAVLEVNHGYSQRSVGAGTGAEA